MNVVAAVIVDIVGSRLLADRAGAQQAVRATFAEADTVVPPVRAAWSTYADEFQAVYASVDAACAATGLVRVLLPDGLDVRFGIGLGSSVLVEHGDTGDVLDGDAWWNARAAIDEAERRAGRSGPERSWVIGTTDDPARNAALLLRDQVISGMKPRERRITAALCLGRTQAEVAASEGIGQSAVSQSARRSGAATLVQVQTLWLTEEDR